ncbi:MAG: phosphatase PAP2 family protein, partial [Acidimicrobiia bacterium]
ASPDAAVNAPVAGAPVADSLPRHRAYQLLLLAFASVALCAGVYLVAVQTTAGQQADNDALEGRAADRPRVQEATGDLLQTISVASIALIGGVCMVVALFRRHPLVALGAGVVILGANVTTQVLKEVLPRPDLVSDDVLGQHNSYPSGHTTVAISLAVAAVIVVPGAWRGLVALIGTGYAALVGAGVVTAGWHYPADPVGAYLVAVAWGAAITAVIVAWRGRSRRYTRSLDDAPLVGPIFAGIGIALLLLAFLATALAALALQSGRLEAVDVTRAYGVSLVAIVGTVTLLMAFLLFCFRGVHIERREHFRAFG